VLRDNAWDLEAVVVADLPLAAYYDDDSIRLPLHKVFFGGETFEVPEYRDETFTLVESAP